MRTARRQLVSTTARRIFNGLIPAVAGLLIGGLIVVTVDQGATIVQQDEQLARQDRLLSIKQHTIDSQDKVLRTLRDSEAHFTITPPKR